MDNSLIPVSASNCTIIRTNDGVAIQQEDKIHTLNGSAVEIFELCTGQQTIDEIIKAIQDRYTDDSVGEIVHSFVEQLHAAGLVSI